MKLHIESDTLIYDEHNVVIGACYTNPMPNGEHTEADRATAKRYAEEIVRRWNLIEENNNGR
jgi:hypothetical protein